MKKSASYILALVVSMALMNSLARAVESSWGSLASIPEASKGGGRLPEMHEEMLANWNKTALIPVDRAKGLDYVPNEIMVKFEESVAQKVAEGLKKGRKASEMRLSASLDDLKGRFSIKEIQPVFRGFQASKARIEKLRSKDRTLLSRDDMKILRRLERAPKNAEIPALDRIYKLTVEVKGGESLKSIAARFDADPGVEYAHVNHIMKLHAMVNDEHYPLQWALETVDANSAWDIETGSYGVTVAVIDTGVDYNHRDLNGNIWRNYDEVSGDGNSDGYPGIGGVDDDGDGLIDEDSDGDSRYLSDGVTPNPDWDNDIPYDDDENGYEDDIMGYDISDGDANVADYYGHGTHCAGVIGAETNNNDIVGVCWDVNIMPVKMFPNATDEVAAEAIMYAADNGADILSCSWGSDEEASNETIEEVIDYACAVGCIPVFSAGNEDADAGNSSPGNYSKTICVAATDPDDKKASFSNYGDAVDIAAPGLNILSLRGSGTSMGDVHDDYTTYASGTSMACPHVSGACALLLCQDVGTRMGLEDVRAILGMTGDTIEEGVCASNARLNLHSMLRVMEGKGIVGLDKTVYSGADVIKISLIDVDLEGQNAQNVTVTTSGGDNETVSLSAIDGNSVTFEGTILTDEATAVTEDGTLQVAHNQIITVSYSDANDGTGNSAVAAYIAIADCAGPAVSNLSVDASLSIPIVSFDTDEPAWVTVYCGTGCGSPYAMQVSGAGPATSHSVKLRGLEADTQYYFVIEATDKVENTTLADNGGQCYTFTTSEPLGNIYVPADFGTIQEAIDHAWSGDVIWLADGIYTGEGNRDLYFEGRAITVISQNGAEYCVLDCQGMGRGFVFAAGEDANTILDGVTIRNAQPDITKNPNPNVPQDRVNGGAVYCLNSNPTIINCRFISNIAGLGSAIYCRNLDIEGAVSIAGCFIFENRARWGGAISIAGNAVIADSIISSNIGGEWSDSGGIQCCYGQVEITDCTIVENDSTENRGVSGGGGIWSWGCDIYVSGSSISRNMSGSGGGIWLGGSNATMRNCVISGNTATTKGGGGIRCDFYSTAVLTNCTITHNVAGEYYDSWGGGFSDTGGGIQCIEENAMLIENCILWGNSDPSNDGNEVYLCSFNSYPELINEVTVSYSDVKGGQAGIHVGQYATLNWDSSSNIDNDPGFAFDDDYHLLSGSQCIDAGTDNPYGGLPSVDLDGNLRSLGDCSDMGAYEYNGQHASIAISPDHFEFGCLENETTEPQDLFIRNCGGGTLYWEVDKDCNWLVVNVSSGSSTGEVDTVGLSIDSNGVPAGDYECELTVKDDDAVNSPRMIPVYLHVQGELRVPEQYSTIQAGIDAAGDGDVVLVADGTYRGNGNRDMSLRGKRIVVKSEAGPESCIIDCNGTADDPHRAFGLYMTGEDANSVISGFTMQGGYVSWDFYKLFPPVQGGAIDCELSNPTITNCIIRKNHALTNGGGIYMIYGFRPLTTYVTNCIVTENEAEWDGGGIYTEDWATISNSVVSNNTCGRNGGGIYFGDTCYPVTNCTVANNSAEYAGGGIYASGGYWDPNEEIELTNTVIWGNAASDGDQIAIVDYNPTDNIDSVITIRHSDIEGGAEDIWKDAYSVVNWYYGNKNENPNFVDEDNDNYHIMSNSPCRDAGDPNGNYSGQTDIDADPRVEGSCVDMGADEIGGCYTGPEYDQWILVGMPEGWCSCNIPRQCHGDTDNAAQSKQSYWVSTFDLDVLLEAWNKPFEDITGQTYNGIPLINADFDHKPYGKNSYRVTNPDLGILLDNWNLANQPDPNCP